MESKNELAKPLLCRFQADERAAIEQAAKDADRPMSREIRRAIRNYYGLDKKRRPAMSATSR
jgi:hypothetical protein